MKSRLTSLLALSFFGLLALTACEAQRLLIQSGDISRRPEAIVTACPLCLKTFGRYSPIPVKDFAEVLAEQLEG